MAAFLIHQTKDTEPRQAEKSLIAGHFGLSVGREDGEELVGRENLLPAGRLLDAIGRGYYGRKRCFVYVFLAVLLVSL